MHHRLSLKSSWSSRGSIELLGGSLSSPSRQWEKAFCCRRGSSLERPSGKKPLHSDSPHTLSMPGYPPRHVCAADRRVLLTYLLTYFLLSEKGLSRTESQGQGASRESD